jgi:tetratricopeptide (TPR) repeat protein
LKETLAASTRKLGADHPDTLEYKHNLAMLYSNHLGKPDQAEPLLRESVEGSRRVLGLEHPDTRIGLLNLANLYLQLKSPAKAEPLLRELVAFQKQRAGADSLPAAAELANLGLNLSQQGRWTESEAVLRECLTIHEQKQPGAWTTCCIQMHLGGALLGQKKYADAEPLLLKGYEGLKPREAQIPARGKAVLAEALERLVQLYEAWGKPDQAAAWRAKRRANSPPKP